MSSTRRLRMSVRIDVHILMVVLLLLPPTRQVFSLLHLVFGEELHISLLHDDIVLTLIFVALTYHGAISNTFASRPHSVSTLMTLIGSAQLLGGTSATSTATGA